MTDHDNTLAMNQCTRNPPILENFAIHAINSAKNWFLSLTLEMCINM